MGPNEHGLLSFPTGASLDPIRMDAVTMEQPETGARGTADLEIKPNLPPRRQTNNNNKDGVSKMDVMKMLGELKQEREHIEEAILTLERLARGRGKRRGRPPSWMKELKRRGRPPGSKNKSKESSVA
jgi:hypothetical protein